MGVRMRYGATVTTDNRSTYTETDVQTGVQVIETLIWENANPTSNFGGREITFTEDVFNGTTPLVDGLKFVYARNTNENAEQYTVEFRFDGELDKFVYDNNNAVFGILLKTSDYRAERAWGVRADNAIYLTSAYRSNNTTAVTNIAIPLEIYAIRVNEDGHEIYPIYDGATTVTPQTTSTTLLTSGMKLNSNITVEAIPYEEVANTYGTTVNIG